jgi:hypothetical protein
MTTKKELLKEKLTNFTEYTKKILGAEHKCVEKLSALKNNYDEFLNLLLTLNYFADKDGNIADERIKYGVATLGIEYEKLNTEVKEKIKKYLRCFLIILRT